MSTQAVELRFSLLGADLLQFNVLEVWRSQELPGGPFEALTAAGAQPARLPSGAPNPPASPQVGRWVNASGRSLLLLIGTAQRTVTASGNDPLTYGQIATQVTAQTLGEVRAYAVDALLVLETNTVGGSARLEVLDGELAGLVGLELAQPAYGREPFLPLVDGQLDYTFVDHQGDPAFWYKWRLRNTLLDEVSAFSAPFQPSRPRITDTAIGFVDLTDMDGSALEAREVRLYSRFNGQLSNGRVVAGYSTDDLTDENGHVEFELIRGLPITVAVAGTTLVRDLVVPTDAAISRFNLLSPEYGVNDVFKVQVPNIPYATRRST